ncbi:protein NCBP2AS2 homolog [Lucilia sericata]|uniref:protein NCBP2AS2 homolog n=1 Tax=Lucilia sericata TaxID=13632 RepID=UPI0018A82159|nr:protein NCBP2AS2 homolog [Lucilia sericata]XP_037826743.1 protein NCBP2AS2 homolog [Lucilia sericata]
MVLRILMRYLANNEQLINRMAESYPMRRAAQIVVSIMYRAKHVAEDKGLHEMTPERFKSFMNVFKSNIKQEIEGVKEELKKKKF